jgi:hypothetical protein
MSSAIDEVTLGLRLWFSAMLIALPNSKALIPVKIKFVPKPIFFLLLEKKVNSVNYFYQSI